MTAEKLKLQQLLEEAKSAFSDAEQARVKAEARASNEEESRARELEEKRACAIMVQEAERELKQALEDVERVQAPLETLAVSCAQPSAESRRANDMEMHRGCFWRARWPSYKTSCVKQPILLK